MALPRIGGGVTGQQPGLPTFPGLNPNFSATGTAPFTAGYYTGLTNAVTLAASEKFQIPAGTWWISRGPYTFLQFLDPVTGRHKNWPTVASDAVPIESDGSNWCLANLTGCPIGAVITAIGTAAVYTNGIGATATGLTVTASSGASTWTPVVGGAISTTVASATATTQTTAGAGYNYIPICVIDAPPTGGLQATAIVTSLSGGTVLGGAIQVLNQGAGYTAAPNITLIPDTREASATTPGPTINAILLTTLTATGTLTGLYPANHGTALTGVPALTFSTGTGAATVVMNFTVTSFALTSTTSGGVAVGTGATVYSTNNLVAAQASPAPLNPLHAAQIVMPRPARITANVVGGVVTTTGSIVEDGGLGIELVPNGALLSTAATTQPSIGTMSVGGVSDTSYIQPF